MRTKTHTERAKERKEVNGISNGNGNKKIKSKHIRWTARTHTNTQKEHSFDDILFLLFYIQFVSQSKTFQSKSI